MAARALGYLPEADSGAFGPDARDFRAQDYERALGLGAAPVRATDLLQHRPPNRDQGWINSCVGQSIAYAINVCHRRDGVKQPPWASVLALYWNSRRMHGATDLDFGTYGRTCLKAAAIAGFCQEDVWPYSEDPIVVRKKPPWNAYRAGVDQNDLGFYRILGDADERLLQFKRAIAAGNPVIFGTDVAEEFTSFVGKKVFGPPSGNIAGGHMMCAIAYEPDDVIALSSWGENSHDGGLHHFTEDVIRWPRTRDIWAIRAAREMLTR